MLNAKPVTAEGKRPDGPAELPAHCLSFSGGEGQLELDVDTPLCDGRLISFAQKDLWHWAISSNHTPRRVSGETVTIAVGARCVVALKQGSGVLQSVQVLPRLTGKISSRPSAQVGQLEPEEQWKEVAAANVFLSLKEMPDAHQLPAVGERVEFHLAPNPGRADRLWASEVVALDGATLARQPVSRSAAAADSGGANADAVPGQPQPSHSFQPASRVYIGRLPTEAGWRELSEMLGHFGELVHLQLPEDDKGKRRSYGVAEFARPEFAAAAIQKCARGRR
jgi:hypothetical protein